MSQICFFRNLHNLNVAGALNAHRRIIPLDPVTSLETVTAGERYMQPVLFEDSCYPIIGRQKVVHGITESLGQPQR